MCREDGAEISSPKNNSWSRMKIGELRKKGKVGVVEMLRGLERVRERGRRGNKRRKDRWESEQREEGPKKRGAEQRRARTIGAVQGGKSECAI